MRILITNDDGIQSPGLEALVKVLHKEHQVIVAAPASQQSAKFIKTLINDGYEEHVTNKIVDNSQVFYHMPENIYSGFNTAENNLISLKDKLIDM